MAKKSKSSGSPVAMAAFLRGVNVGGKNKVPMAELRAAFESLGHTEVSTYIASGNVLFRAATPAGDIAGPAAAAILKVFKVTSPVVVRTLVELAGAIEAAPFEGDESRVLIGFCAAKPKGSPDPARSPHDQVAVVGREVHLHCPRGVSESKFTADYLDRTLGTTVTFRNLRTCREVLARLTAMGG